MMKLFLWGLCLALSYFPSYADTADTEGDATRALLKTIIEQTALPIYQKLDTQAKQLVKESSVFCQAPTVDSLGKLRNAWSETLSAWQQSQSFLFGPSTEEQIDFTVYFLPIKKQIIKGLLKAPMINAEAVKKAGVGAQGLASIEYMLFDRDKTDQALLAMFVSTPQHCDYLQAVTAVLAESLNTMHNAWSKAGDSGYGQAVMMAGKGSVQFTEAYQPLELLINRMYQTIQAIRLKKLVGALGLNRQGKKPQRFPYKLEAWRSGHSLKNIQHNIIGVEQIWTKGGLAAYVDKQGQAELAKKITKQLSALQQFSWPSGDLFAYLATAKPEGDEVDAYYTLLNNLEMTVRDELAPALKVQLGFNDNDGD